MHESKEQTLKTPNAADWTAAIDPKLPVATQAHAWIRRSILSLELQPMDALSEKELAVKFGISRTPVREALIKLAEEGLVDIRPQRGTYVSPIRIPEVLEAQFIREALETAVVRAAAEKTDERFLATLNKNLREQDVAIRGHRLTEFMHLDEMFHHAFSDFCELPRAWRVIENVKGQLDRVRYLSLPQPGHVIELYEQHSAVVEAIIDNEVDTAVARMRHHLREVFASIDELMREQPALFSA